MTPATFTGMVSSTPDEFEFSVKVPETVTHDKKIGRFERCHWFIRRIPR